MTHSTAYKDVMDALESENGNLAVVYARYSNQLAIAADSDNYKKIKYLNEVVDILRCAIAQAYMKEHSWNMDMDDEWHRWKKCEEKNDAKKQDDPQWN